MPRTKQPLAAREQEKREQEKRDQKREDDPRSGSVAVVGRPNVGKSTLLNALVGERLAVATSKPQTTRARLLGVAHVEDPPTQIAFIDTPGLHRPKNALGRALVEEAKAALAEVDAVAMVVECDRGILQHKELGAEDLEVLAAARGAQKPIVLVLNKADRVRDKRELLPLVERLHARGDFAAIVPLSATRRVNVDALVRALREHLHEGASWGDEFLTDRPERFFVAELLREQVIAHTREEVPHAIAVVIERFEDEAPNRPGSPGLSRIGATIAVEKEGQKKIVIGARGAMLKEIGTAARGAMEAFLGRRVHLELWVKVVPGWTDDAQRVRELVQAGG